MVGLVTQRKVKQADFIRYFWKQLFFESVGYNAEDDLGASRWGRIQDAGIYRV